jgi:DNA (cytosine-5)-methyltransferase 1
MSGLGETIWQVEKDPFCRSILAHHWPDAERHSHVEDVGATNLSAIDLLCGGFPCQNLSSAGKSEGLSGSRSGLWTHFARIVRELGPEWVIVENVASGAKQWVDSVCTDLGQLGYETLPVPLTAQNVCAPHLRRRVFIVAHSNRFALRNQSEWLSWRREVAVQGKGKAVAVDDGCPGVTSRASTWAPRPTLHRVDDGSTGQVDRCTAIGNSVVPQCAEVVGWVIRELAGA